MLRLALAMAMGAASAACAFAAVGWTLYADHPQALWAAQCFGAWGALAGLACGALHLQAHGRPAHAPPALPADELAGLVRAAIARAAAERQARPGNAADRVPAAVAADPAIVREPVLLVEVQSPSTSGYDAGPKFAAYRQLPSLQEYLLVDVDRQRCDLFRKGADGLWVLHPSEPGQAVHLACVDLTVPPEALWADLEPLASDPVTTDQRSGA